MPPLDRIVFNAEAQGWYSLGFFSGYNRSDGQQDSP